MSISPQQLCLDMVEFDQLDAATIEGRPGFQECDYVPPASDVPASRQREEKGKNRGEGVLGGLFKPTKANVKLQPGKELLDLPARANKGTIKFVSSTFEACKKLHKNVEKSLPVLARTANTTPSTSTTSSPGGPTDDEERPSTEAVEAIEIALGDDAMETAESHEEKTGRSAVQNAYEEGGSSAEIVGYKWDSEVELGRKFSEAMMQAQRTPSEQQHVQPQLETAESEERACPPKYQGVASRGSIPDSYHTVFNCDDIDGENVMCGKNDTGLQLHGDSGTTPQSHGKPERTPETQHGVDFAADGAGETDAIRKRKDSLAGRMAELVLRAQQAQEKRLGPGAAAAAVAVAATAGLDNLSLIQHINSLKGKAPPIDEKADNVTVKGAEASGASETVAAAAAAAGGQGSDGQDSQRPVLSSGGVSIGGGRVWAAMGAMADAAGAVIDDGMQNVLFG